MSITVICLLYVVGALIMARHRILVTMNEIDEDQDKFDKLSKKERKEAEGWRLEWDSEDTWEAIFMSALWPGFVAYGIVKFLMFPRGIKSKFAREKEKAEAVKDAEDKAAKAEAALFKMQEEVLRFAPQETPEESLRRLKLVVDGQRPDDDPPVKARVAS